MKTIKLNDWATLRVMSKKEFREAFPDEDQNQQSPSTDVDNDGEVNPETDLNNEPRVNPGTTAGEPNEGDVEEEDETEDGEDDSETSETSKQLAATLRRLVNGKCQRSTRSLDQLHISERKANEAAKPEPEATRTSETTDALTAAMQRVREAKSKA
jgi:hypothetical protein